jgi:hypothetical protein
MINWINYGFHAKPTLYVWDNDKIMEPKTKQNKNLNYKELGFKS